MVIPGKFWRYGGKKQAIIEVNPKNDSRA